VVARPVPGSALRRWGEGSAGRNGPVEREKSPPLAGKTMAGHSLSPLRPPGRSGARARRQAGPDRGREARLPGLPSLRTVRAVLPHTALRSVVLPHRGWTARTMAKHRLPDHRPRSSSCLANNQTLGSSSSASQLTASTCVVPGFPVGIGSAHPPCLSPSHGA